MKFKRIYSLLITEDKWDEYKELHPELVGDLYYRLKNTYTYLDEDLKKHNKFSNFFFNWYVKDIKIATAREYGIKIPMLFAGYLKYNIDLNRYTVESLYKYIEEREHKNKLVLDGNAKKIYEDDQKVVIRVWNVDGSMKYGSSTWCISNENREKALDHWFDYIFDGKNTYFVLWKDTDSHIISDIYDNNGDDLNLNKVICIQKDLYNDIFITNAANTVGAGINTRNNLNKVNKIIKDYLKLDIDLFKSFKEDTEFKFFVEKNLDDKILEAEGKSGSDVMRMMYKAVGKVMNDTEVWLDATDRLQYDAIEEIIKNKEFNINVQDRYGNTGLFLLCAAALNDIKSNEERYKKVLDMLLARSDIDVNIANKTEFTPFLAACESNNTIAVLKLLERKDLDVNIQDARDYTGLMLAIRNENIEIVRACLHSGRRDFDLTLTNMADDYNVYDLSYEINNYDKLKQVQDLLKEYEENIKNEKV